MQEQKLRVRLGEDGLYIKEGLHGIELPSGHNVASYVTEVAEVQTLEGGNINVSPSVFSNSKDYLGRSTRVENLLSMEA